MKIETLQDCLILKIMAMYDVESEILKALPKMIKNATNEKLVESLTEHLGETENHVTRLESMFEALDMKPKKTKVEAMRGLVDDAAWCLDQDTTPITLDSLIIGATRHVEHYEISGYLQLVGYAKILGLTEIETLASETLEEEKNADSTLSELEETVAMSGGDEEADTEADVPEADEEEE